MMAELGPDWQKRFGSFDLRPAAAASLGQVHRATGLDGTPFACKLQYPDMQSAVEADLKQLEIAFALHRRLSSWLDTREIAKEIGARVREELDYEREAKHAALYGAVLQDIADVRVPAIHTNLSTKRLLTLGWLEGDRILDFTEEPIEIRNRLAQAMFKAWWHPFSRAAVIHGDPHLGNYTVFSEDGEARGINLLDYGCVRIFHPRFVGGVVDLYRGLLDNDHARIVHAYEVWGFKNLTKELIEILNIWARFIYGPILEDRTRTVADGVKPGEYGRRQAFEVHQALKQRGPVTVPQEFVFMDRAAVGARRGVPAPAFGAELPSAVRGRDRALLPRNPDRASGHGPDGGRPSAPGLGKPRSRFRQTRLRTPAIRRRPGGSASACSHQSCSPLGSTAGQARPPAGKLAHDRRG